MEPKGPNIDQKGAERGPKNIEKFAPEEVKVYLEGQAVMVHAEKRQGEIICDSYEQKISMPSDVDTERLTSGISKD